MWCNRGKESVTLNTKSPAGMDLLHRLLDRADAFVGRRLRALFVDAGLDDVRTDVAYVTSDALGREVFARMLLHGPRTLSRRFAGARTRLSRRSD